MFPLSASGWCERAERLISDRLDGELADPGRRRLDAHLGNCDRCVEHERALGEAREALVRRFVELHPAGEPEPEPAPTPAPELRVVESEPAERPAQPKRLVPPARPAKPTRRDPTGLAWNAMLGLSVLLTVVSALVAILAATGAVDRIF